MQFKSPNKLYHYTSISNFALIIKNRNICFNSLANMDDPDEEIGRDYGNKTNIGKHIYASCWTDESEESIPMWNQYAGGMHGVRICMPCFPFIKYHFAKGEFGSTYGGTFYFDHAQYYYEDKFMVPGDVALGQIKYTEVEEDLYPDYKETHVTGIIKDDRGQSIADIDNSYKLGLFGKHKRTAWRFQKEWRYLIETVPYGMKSFVENGPEKHKEISRRLDDESYVPYHRKLFLKIDPMAFDQMEVLLGPKIDEGEKYLVDCMLKQIKFKGSVSESTLKVR